ncbi:MAG: hypothetical protein F6K32_02920 [Desertifilum sp. SIO1I2]|nr:hypothetical protein [Desertifilum sp. SIO1I2]
MSSRSRHQGIHNSVEIALDWAFGEEIAVQKLGTVQRWQVADLSTKAVLVFTLLYRS